MDSTSRTTYTVFWLLSTLLSTASINTQMSLPDICLGYYRSTSVPGHFPPDPTLPPDKLFLHQTMTSLAHIASHDFMTKNLFNLGCITKL
jgi:hypothetical protein